MELAQHPTGDAERHLGAEYAARSSMETRPSGLLTASSHDSAALSLKRWAAPKRSRRPDPSCSTSGAGAKTRKWSGQGAWSGIGLRGPPTMDIPRVLGQLRGDAAETGPFSL